MGSFLEKVESELKKISKEKRELNKFIARFVNYGTPFVAQTTLFDGSNLFACTKPTRCAINTSIYNATAYALIERNLQVLI